MPQAPPFHLFRRLKLRHSCRHPSTSQRTQVRTTGNRLSRWDDWLHREACGQEVAWVVHPPLTANNPREAAERADDSSARVLCESRKTPRSCAWAGLARKPRVLSTTKGVTE